MASQNGRSRALLAGEDRLLGGLQMRRLGSQEGPLGGPDVLGRSPGTPEKGGGLPG